MICQFAAGLAHEEISQAHPAFSVVVSSGIRADWGIIIVGVKKKEQQDMIFNPAPQTPIEANDLLITLGEREAILKLGEIAPGAGS